MSEPKNKKNHLQQIKKSEYYTHLYGLLAVLLVIIPEWIAQITLKITTTNRERKLPMEGSAWKHNPELKLSIMSIKDLRALAKNLNLIGYASDSKKILSKRVLAKLKKKEEKIYK